MAWHRMRLATRLGLTHGALVAVLVVVFGVTLHGLLRLLGVLTIISDQRLSTLDADEELHRAAWGIEVALRHGRAACAEGSPDAVAREKIERARSKFRLIADNQAVEHGTSLRQAARRYEVLADDALAGPTCAFLSTPEVEHRRTKLDEEMTDAWIARLQELHVDIENMQALARRIGNRTAVSGLVVAVVGALAAGLIARSTARSITRPMARLAADATRLGDGDFAPIAPVGGPLEIEDLRRDLERTREKLLGVERLKHAFLASVSHELRSPLGRLREALALLGDGTVGELTPQQARVVTLARRACEQEVRIVEALLDMSRVSSGLPVQREEACEIDKVVEAAVEGERPAAIERGVEVRVIRPPSPPSLRIDSALVERAVANLVRNAVSVSPRGEEVRVEIGIDSKAGRRIVHIDVIDRGPGLSEELASRIFQPFSSAAVAEANRPAGIGLGLALAREVARAHGGDLGVTRAHGATTFRMEIPIETVDTGSAPSSAMKEAG
jgi:two-component system sensor histidine kinase GlrK